MTQHIGSPPRTGPNKEEVEDPALESGSPKGAKGVDPILVADDDRFNKLVEEARAIKNRYIDPEYQWYRRHQHWPFIFFRSAGIITIVLGVTLPAVAGFGRAYWPHQGDLVLSLMSVTIAALTGLSSFYRWERSWRGRSVVRLGLEALSAKWELEIANARVILSPTERLQHVYMATNDLIANVRNLCNSETEEFFSGMQFPQSDRTTKA
jgi:hypothetical protein